MERFFPLALAFDKNGQICRLCSMDGFSTEESARIEIADWMELYVGNVSQAWIDVYVKGNLVRTIKIFPNIIKGGRT